MHYLIGVDGGGTKTAFALAKTVLSAFSEWENARAVGQRQNESCSLGWRAGQDHENTPGVSK